MALHAAKLTKPELKKMLLAEYNRGKHNAYCDLLATLEILEPTDSRDQAAKIALTDHLPDDVAERLAKAIRKFWR